MKRIASVLLLACLGFPAFAIEPCPNQDAYSSYLDSMNTSKEQVDKDADVEKAEAAIQAGKDPSETMAPTAAGEVFKDHPYFGGGNFGKPGCE